MSALEDEVLGEVRRVFVSELDIEREVMPGDDLTRDLQLDSLLLLTLVVGLEDRFHVALGEEDAPTVRTIADLVALVVRRMGERERRAAS